MPEYDLMRVISQVLSDSINKCHEERLASPCAGSPFQLAPVVCDKYRSFLTCALQAKAYEALLSS